ncbi:MAG: transposase [Planctomycetia bacterium]|nr:transposase [Planctomycetia bacterium]
MPRRARSLVGGYPYHVLNRANGRLRLFKKEEDFAAFDAVVRQTLERVPLRLLGFCVMSNHWHFVVWPRRDEGPLVSEFFRLLTVTHSRRWHAHRRTSGMGHVYRGRFKAFPVEADEHLLTVLRYVERNALRAGMVARAEDWRWGSLWLRVHGSPDEQAILTDPPVKLGRDWPEQVNRPQTDGEVAALRRSVNRGQPYGGDVWRARTIRRLGLEHTVRSQGRPRKTSLEESPDS